MKYFLTGATGFIGSWLAEKLSKSGAEVSCLVRPKSNRRWLEGLPLEFCEGDLFDEAALLKGLHGADYVLHIAGTVKALSKSDYYRVNLEGTRFLLETVKKSGARPKRFLYLSSQAANGPSPDGVFLDESCAPAPVSHYGKSKLEAEEIVRSYSSLLPYTILRPCVVYGPRDTGMLPVFKLAALGFAVSIGKKETLFSVIHVDDLVNTILLALEATQAENKTYFAASKEACTPSMLCELLQPLLQRHWHSIHVPSALAYSAALVLEVYARLTNQPQILNRDKLKEATQNCWLISGMRLKTDCAFLAERKLSDGLRDTLRWYKEQKWI